jgi:hypothetical protein
VAKIGAFVVRHSGATARDLHPSPYSPQAVARGTLQGFHYFIIVALRKNLDTYTNFWRNMSIVREFQSGSSTRGRKSLSASAILSGAYRAHSAARKACDITGRLSATLPQQCLYFLPRTPAARIIPSDLRDASAPRRAGPRISSSATVRRRSRSFAPDALLRHCRIGSGRSGKFQDAKI